MCATWSPPGRSTRWGTIWLRSRLRLLLQIGSTADLGYVFLAREIPTVIFLLAGGVWADRVSRKALLVIGDLATGSAQAATALLFLTHQASVWRVALLQMTFGVSGAFTRPASTGLISQAISHAHLQEANALLDLSRSMFRVVGPAHGGLIVVLANPGWALAADAATFFITATLQLQLQIPAAERPARTRMLHELREGWTEFTPRTWLWTMVTSFGLFQLTLFPALLVLGPTVAKAHLGGAGVWGVILAFQGAGTILGGLIALRLHPRRPLVAATLLCVPIALVLALLGAAAPVPLLCVAGFLASLGLTCGDIIWFTTFQLQIPDHLMSRLRLLRLVRLSRAQPPRLRPDRATREPARRRQNPLPRRRPQRHHLAHRRLHARHPQPRTQTVPRSGHRLIRQSGCGAEQRRRASCDRIMARGGRSLGNRTGHLLSARRQAGSGRGTSGDARARTRRGTWGNARELEAVCGCFRPGRVGAQTNGDARLPGHRCRRGDTAGRDRDCHLGRSKRRDPRPGSRQRSATTFFHNSWLSV
jgi:MFS family permease